MSHINFKSNELKISKKNVIPEDKKSDTDSDDSGAKHDTIAELLATPITTK